MKKKHLVTTSIFIFLLMALSGLGYSLRPQCALIADEALSHFGVPIEERQDRDFYLKVFQQKEDGHWYQCKTALSRSSFF